MQTSSCTVSATPVGASTTPEVFLDTALLILDPCRFGTGLFLLPFFITAGDSVLNFVIIKTAPICGAKGDDHHAEYSSVTPPNSPRVARIWKWDISQRSSSRTHRDSDEIILR